MEEAKELFTSLLGTEPYIDGPDYVGYRTEAREIGLDPHGTSSGPWPGRTNRGSYSERSAGGWMTSQIPTIYDWARGRPAFEGWVGSTTASKTMELLAPLWGEGE